MEKVEEKLVERLEVTSRFVDLPDYDDEVLESVGNILSSGVFESYNRSHLFPDPNGEFTIILTNGPSQFQITVRGREDIDCISRGSGDTKRVFSSGYEEVVNLLEESLK